MDIVQIAALGIVAVCLALIVKNQRPELALLISAATGVIILINLLGKIKTVIDSINDFTNVSGIDAGFIGILLRVVGIAYIAEFGAEICRDAGENAIAAKMEIAGKVTIMLIAIPVMMSILEMLTKVL